MGRRDRSGPQRDVEVIVGPFARKRCFLTKGWQRNPATGAGELKFSDLSVSLNLGFESGALVPPLVSFCRRPTHGRDEFCGRKAGEWSAEFMPIVKSPRHLYFFANKIGLRKNTDLAALSLLKKKREIAMKIPTCSDCK